MTRIIDLAPHDPLPGGPAIVLLRRFEEDDPRRVMMEIIALDAHHTESNARLTDAGGHPPSWEDATARAIEAAEKAGVEVLHRIDRLGGDRERAIEAHDGDHSIETETLDDFDLEDGATGSDMRDRGNSGGPRRF